MVDLLCLEFPCEFQAGSSFYREVVLFLFLYPDIPRSFLLKKDLIFRVKVYGFLEDRFDGDDAFAVFLCALLCDFGIVLPLQRWPGDLPQRAEGNGYVFVYHL